MNKEGAHIDSNNMENPIVGIENEQGANIGNANSNQQLPPAEQGANIGGANFPSTSVADSRNRSHALPITVMEAERANHQQFQAADRDAFGNTAEQGTRIGGANFPSTSVADSCSI